MARWLETRLSDIKSGRNLTQQVVFTGPVPQDHTRDYDRVISMYEMDISEETDVNEYQYSIGRMGLEQHGHDLEQRVHGGRLVLHA